MSKSASPSPTAALINDGPLNVYKYRWLFIGISLLFLLPGLYFIGANMANPEIQAPIRLGIDFRGGTLLEYGFSKPVKQDDIDGIRAVFDEHNYTGSIIQIQEPRVGIDKKPMEIGAANTETPESGTSQQTNKPTHSEENTTAAQPLEGKQATTTKSAHETQQAASKPALATKETSAAVTQADNQAGKEQIANIVSIRSKHIQGQDDVSIRKDLEAKYGPITVLQKNSIGPALAKELLGNGLLALVMAYILIMGYLTFRFQFDFAVCAMVALLHDTLFLLGMFAMFGALFHTEVDSLFITAVLTVIGFSVHDTIVVFDRIRENLRVYYTKKLPFIQIVNMSVNQTLARSINTSLTALLTMLALYIFGGESTRDFVLAIIIGIAAGTYSSIFNASVLLAMWRNRGQQAQGSPQGKPVRA